MVRSNTKQAIARIREYIISAYTNDESEAEEWPTIAREIYDSFDKERYYPKGRKPEAEAFKDWCMGLPSILCLDYWKAKPVVAYIMDETPEEAEKYTDDQAWEFLLHLIFREISKGTKQ